MGKNIQEIDYLLTIGFNDNKYPIKITQDVFDSLEVHMMESKRFLERSKYNNQEIVVNKKYFSAKHKVPNVCRYTLIIKANNFSLEKNLCSNLTNSNYNDIFINDVEKNSSILVILESPHENEYDNNFNVKGPAQGITGQRVYKYLPQVVEEILNTNLKINDGSYKVVLFNPIPFQTSLNYLHKQGLNSTNIKNLRDAVWKTLWYRENVFRSNMESTLKELDPIIILNACTKSLKKEVSNVLKSCEEVKHKSFLIGHPSFWHTESHRTPEKLV
ncbi:hypothetical protein [Lysinibacillus sp. NPDC093688]|uniref:hypothetical protein n=1 Tax=Lysinibacillus sp. NPDC093688 TaxID=3390577 RepID=UPI003CFE3D06